MSPVRPLVLLVEDDPDFAEVVSLVLQGAGYGVVHAAEPTAALDLLREQRPDLIITDLMMTALDSGFTFARQVRAQPEFRHLPIVVVTGVAAKSGFDFRPRCAGDLEHMQVDAYFDKSVPPNVLVAKVRELLDARRAAAAGPGPGPARTATP